MPETWILSCFGSSRRVELPLTANPEIGVSPHGMTSEGSRIHIGFLALDYPSARGGGGVGTQVQTLGRHLVARGQRVTVVALGDGHTSKIANDNGVRVIYMPHGSLHWYVSKLPVLGGSLALAVRELERAWHGWRRIRDIHREDPFDVIEITEQAGVFVAWFVREVALVGRLHGEQYTFRKHLPGPNLDIGVRLSRVFQRAALRRATTLVSPSRAHAKEISAELRRRHPPIEVIPHANAWAGEKACGNPSVPRKEPFFVLYAGRLERLKGVPILIEAAALVVEDAPEIRFVLAGGYHPTLPKEELHALVQARGLEGRIEIPGHLPPQELLEWYRRASICVLPSYYETFGLAALEPMSLGVPVVATATGSLPELITDHETGLLVPAGDPRALADAILKLHIDDRLRQSMGEACLERVRREFSVASVVDRNLGLYRRLCLDRT